MRRFSQVDVFSSELGFGNAVAVVHDAGGLADEEMAALARWTQLSETTFLLPAEDLTADYRLRIFTTEGELPFAGHPTLGSARAWLEAGGDAKDPETLVQECGAGLVAIRRSGERLAFRAPPLVRSGPVDAAHVSRIADGLRLGAGQVVDAQWADNGPGWVALLLDDARSVLSIEPRPAAFTPTDNVGVVGPYPAGSAADFEVRAFFTSGSRFVEDPVTGSLNAAIGQWLVPAGVAPVSYVVSQGTCLGRRGRVYVECAGGDVWVGGDTVLGIAGTIAL